MGLKKFCFRFLFSRRGGIATTAAIMMPALLGLGALSADVGYWFWDRRNMQTAADSAALAAAFAYHEGETTSAASARGVAMAGQNGYSAADGDTITVTVNGATGRAVAEITHPADLFVSNVLLSAGDIDIAARAEAGPRQSRGVCLLAMRGFATGIDVNGGAAVSDINATNCSVQSNSSDPTAITTNGSDSWIDAESVCANYSEPPSASQEPNTTPPVHSCPRMADPFPNQLTPEWNGTPADCPTSMGAATTDGPGNSGVTTVISSGCYRNTNLNVTTQFLEFEPGGVFYFHNVTFSVGGFNEKVTGDDITIFLYGDSTIDTTGTGQLNLSAKDESDPDFPNILIAADASTSDDLRDNTVDTVLAGNSKANVKGIIYLPYQDLGMRGSADFTATDAIIAADTVERSGTGTTTITAPGANTPTRTIITLLQ